VDLFGFADQCAFHGGIHLLVQSTDVGDISKRRKKVLASDLAEDWKRACAGNLIYLVGWYSDDRPLPRVEEVQWDALTAQLVSVKLDDPVAHLDVRDPQGVARARGKP
jgi:hypothetical protein